MATIEVFKTLAQAQLATSVTAIYTAPASTAGIVRRVVIVNNDTVDRTFRLYKNGTGAANAITPTLTIDAGGFAEWDGAMAFAATESLRAIGSVSSQLTITVDGVEVPQ